MSGVTDGLERYRDPEYTGANRCLPCTVVNLCIAVLASTTLIPLATVAGVGELAVPLGVATLLVSLGTIYFKGYLVPGTPTLTKRYFPKRALAAFGKEPATGVTGEASDEPEAGEVDVESVLVGADVLTQRADGTDLRLTDGFDAAFREQVDEVRDAPATPERLLDVLGVERGEVTVEEHGDAFRVLEDGKIVGTWESRPAFLADVAAAELLSERLDSWSETTVRQRGQLLNGLRLFLTTCPGCGGDLSFGTDTVESCCSTHEVAAVSCDDCDARVFEASAAG